MAINKFTKKEKNLFFAGALLGLMGGLVGNIFITSMYRLIDKDYSLSNSLTFIVSMLVCFGIFFWLQKQIRK